MFMNRPYANLTRTLMDEIGRVIACGEYLPGARLPTEAELSDRYQASRTATREAIKMLTAKGLVRSWPKRGTIVEEESRWNLMDPDVLTWLLDRSPSATLVNEFLTMRLAIEPAAAEMAANIGTDTSEIHAALLAMKKSEDGSGDAIEADSTFHGAVLRSSGNRFFAQMAPLVSTALRLTVRLTNQIKGVRTASTDDHERILVAIDAGRGQEARQATEDIIQEALHLVASQCSDQSLRK